MVSTFYFFRICWGFICYPSFEKYMDTKKEIAINYMRSSGLCVCVCLFIYLVYGSH